MAMEAKSKQFKPRICVWEDLSLTDTEKLQKCGSTVGSVQKALREILGVTSEDKQSMIELDLYTYGILFAKTNSYNTLQMSAFFTILKSVHKLCISTPFDNQEQALELFNDLLVCHGVIRPPYSVGLFSLAQVKAITDYILSSYFRHYKLYKYAFTRRVRLKLKLVYDGEEDSEDVESCENVDASEKEEVKNEIEEEVKNVSEEEPDDPVDKEDTEPSSNKDDESTHVEQDNKADQNNLKDIVSSTLSKKLKDLEASIEQEISTQEHKLSQRIGALEQLVGEKMKQKR